MTDGAKQLSPKQLSWVRRQLGKPAEMYLVAELVLLCRNINHRRLRRNLIRKGVIPATVGKGREHIVYFSKLRALWPELWLSIKRAWQETTDDEPLGECG